jgi:hypothetical protein
MSAIGKAYRLKIIPYGPAGIELIPKGFRNMMQAIDSIVETTDETRMKDWYQLVPMRNLTEYLRGPNDLSISLAHRYSLPFNVNSNIIQQYFCQKQFGRIGKCQRMNQYPPELKSVTQKHRRTWWYVVICGTSWRCRYGFISVREAVKVVTPRSSIMPIVSIGEMLGDYLW